MNILERAIAAVSPTKALKRLQDRVRLERLGKAVERVRRYEGADRGRRTQGWVSLDTSATSATRGALHELRARCRDLRRNNTWAKGAVEALVSDFVGDGMRPKFLHDKDKVLKSVKQLWDDWAGDGCACDPAGGESFYALQAGAVESMVEGGECLIRRRLRRMEDGLPVPLQLQVIEADHIDTFRDGYLSPGGAQTVQGKVYDAIGRLTGYWLFPTHPGDRYSVVSESVLVPSEQLRSLYRKDRRGQVRGIPWAASAVIRQHDFDAYEDNEALRLVVATSFSAFVKDVDPDRSFLEGVPGGPGAPRTSKNQPIDELEAGTIEYLDPGKDIVFPNLPQNEGFPAYAMVQLRAIARGYGVPYERLTGDLTGVNFASYRAGMLGYWRDLSRWRKHILIPGMCEPAVRWFVDAAFIAGKFDDAGLSWTWIPPRREMVDPRTEIMAEVAQVRAGFTSWSDVVQSYGRDPDEVREELAADLQKARDADLVLSVDGQAPDPGAIRGVNAQPDDPAARALYGDGDEPARLRRA